MNYYDNKEFVSNSMLGWLERSPSYFKSQLDRNSEEFETKSLERGKLLHSYIEEPSKFIIADINKPGPKTALFVEEFARCRDIAKAKEFAGLAKTTKIETLEASLKEPEIKSYLDFLELSNGKICLNKEDSYKIQGAIAALHRNTVSDRLLFPDELAGDITIHKELEIYFSHNGVPTKSKLDNVKINREKKHITVVDLKTTNENPHGVLQQTVDVLDYELPPEIQYKSTGWFRSFFKYKYYRQGAFYVEAIKSCYPEYADYTISFIFVVVELGNNFDVAVYKLGDQLRMFGLIDMERLLEKYIEYEPLGFKSHEVIITI